MRSTPPTLQIAAVVVCGKSGELWIMKDHRPSTNTSLCSAYTRDQPAISISDKAYAIDKLSYSAGLLRCTLFSPPAMHHGRYSVLEQSSNLAGMNIVTISDG